MFFIIPVYSILLSYILAAVLPAFYLMAAHHNVTKQARRKPRAIDKITRDEKCRISENEVSEKFCGVSV